jgi:hypothetical protein
MFSLLYYLTAAPYCQSNTITIGLITLINISLNSKSYCKTYILQKSYYQFFIQIPFANEKEKQFICNRKVCAVKLRSLC